MTKRKKKVILTIFLIIGVLFFAALLFLGTEKFGSLSKGERLERIKNSPNYRNGKFQNLSYTQQLTGDKNIFRQLWDFQFKKNPHIKPKKEIPHVKTDLLNLERDKDILVWLGHSSLFIQIDGKRFLIDPLFEKPASPVPFYNRPFKGADAYTVKDIPEIDYLIITHDHWDHLDYETALEMKTKLTKVICGLGVGAHFERWGYPKDTLIELDWNEEAELEESFKVFCLPARHFSGRSIKPNQSLWASFLIQAPTFKFYAGGDSGYDTFYADIGNRFGEIDLAMLDDGQYDEGWKYIHMLPEQTFQAAVDLKAKRLLPIHNSKYILSVHAWDDPLVRVSEAAKNNDSVKLITPIIGEVVKLKDENQFFSQWWTTID